MGYGILFRTLIFCAAFYLVDSALPNCGTDGIYDSVEERCRCVSGFTGINCSTCLTKPHADQTHICCPVEHDQYALIAVPDSSLDSYFGGTMGTRGQCVLPNITLARVGVKLDCSCTRNDTKGLLLQHSLSSGNDPVSDASYRLTALSGNPSPGWVGDLMEQMAQRSVTQAALLCDDDVSSLTGVVVFISLAGIATLSAVGLIIWILWSYGFRVNVTRKPRKTKSDYTQRSSNDVQPSIFQLHYTTPSSAYPRR